MDFAFRLKTRKKAALLDAMTNLFAGADSSIAFEGNLHNTKLRDISGASDSESSALK